MMKAEPEIMALLMVPDLPLIVLEITIARTFLTV